MNHSWQLQQQHLKRGEEAGMQLVTWETTENMSPCESLRGGGVDPNPTYFPPWDGGIPSGRALLSAIFLEKKLSLFAADASSSDLVYISSVDLDLDGASLPPLPPPPARSPTDWCRLISDDDRKSSLPQLSQPPLLTELPVCPSGGFLAPAATQAVEWERVSVTTGGSCQGRPSASAWMRSR